MLTHLRTFMTPDGVLFGTTILGRNASHNLFGKTLIALYNWMGTLGNADDSPHDFVDPLKEAFEAVDWRVEGVVLLFEARSPRF